MAASIEEDVHGLVGEAASASVAALGKALSLDRSPRGRAFAAIATLTELSGNATLALEASSRPLATGDKAATARGLVRALSAVGSASV